MSHTTPPAKRDGPPPGLPYEVRIDGHGLRLRDWTDADPPVMVELFDEPAVDRWTPLHHPFDLAAGRAYLAAARARHADGRAIQLAITTDGVTALGEILLFLTGPAGPRLQGHGRRTGLRDRRRPLPAGPGRPRGPADHRLR